MIQLKLDWHQSCTTCGVEIIFDFLNERPNELLCPWCGSTILINKPHAYQEAVHKLACAIERLSVDVPSEILEHSL